MEESQIEAMEMDYSITNSLCVKSMNELIARFDSSIGIGCRTSEPGRIFLCQDPMMSNSNGPLVGLGDKDFDSSIYSQEVDFDFFDESYLPGSTTAPVTTEPEIIIHESEPRSESPKPIPPPSTAVFSTGSLLASISSLSGDTLSDSNDDEAKGDVNGSHEHKTLFSGVPRTRLFDISDTSSDEDEESQPHMIANLNSIFLRKDKTSTDSVDEDNYLTDDSNLSDITEVTPISSLACSPMPSPCAPDLTQEDSNDWIDYEGVKQQGDMHLEHGSNEHLAPLHLSVVDMTSPVIPCSYLLMESSNNGPTLDPNVNANSHSTLGDYHSEKFYNFAEAFKDEAMMNGHGIHRDAVTNLNPSFLSSSSSETGSGFFDSSSSMSVPSGAATTTMSMSGSSTSTKVFGHTRHNNCRNKCKNYSFTKDEVRRIDRDNQILLRKLLDTQKRKHQHYLGNMGVGNHLKIKSHSTTHAARAKAQAERVHEAKNMIHNLQRANAFNERMKDGCPSNKKTKAPDDIMGARRPQTNSVESRANGQLGH